MELKGTKINFLGDSITEGHGASSIDHVYWKLLEERDGVIARGYGIGGTRIARQQVPMPPEHAKQSVCWHITTHTIVGDGVIELILDAVQVEHILLDTPIGLEAIPVCCGPGALLGQHGF